ncbi:hypothetical protein [Siphonobacter curvatus]|uniref:Lipoprotein n=1 Tax=Siphonobacter curvatus TaxID=2094562 RepID=A0A2S7IJ61_9BACT|nr:hypothetical protein [Siphonobacter curvatus]PQA56354.1 hypothetical protein C5O19_18625 [Siphonobacter curvatus]
MRIIGTFFILNFILSGCKTNGVDPAESKPEYYMEATIEGKVHLWKVDLGSASNQVDRPNFKGYLSMGAYDKDQITNIGFVTSGGLDGTPKTLPITYGYYRKSRFEDYKASINSTQSVSVGSCTVTKVDSYGLEGTFYFDAYNESNQKISLTNGKFKLRFF